MSAPDDASTLAVVVARIEDLRTDVAGLRREIKDQNGAYVSRSEFEAWRTGIGREIGDLKASRVAAEPWHLTPGVTVGLILAGLALLAPALSSLIQLIDKIAN